MIELVIDVRMIRMSGIGTYIQNILPGLVNSGEFNITCLGYADLVKYKWFKKVKFIEMDSKILSIGEQVELCRKIPSCDIFWSPNWNVPLLHIKAKERVVTIHDVYHLANYQEFSKIKIMVVRIFMIFIKLFYRKIITVSEFSKKEINKYTKIPINKISVVPLSVEDNYDEFEMSSPINESYILFVGNVKPHKNLSFSLRAFREINDKDIKFYIVGKRDGFITPDSDLAKEMIHLSKRVVFTGEISTSQLKTYYKYAKIFLFPSKYEGFGLPILEAMKFKLPIICSSSASIPEVAGDAVIYFNAEDKNELVNKINWFLEGKIKCDVQKYEAHLLNFSWSYTIAKHIKILTTNNENSSNR